MSDRTTMMFEKEEFNSLINYLQIFEDQDVIKKMKKYYSIKEEKGKTYISIGFFGDELRDIIWKLLTILPERTGEDVFAELEAQYRERENQYYRELEQLKENIRNELIANPDIKGTELAAKLNVSKDKIYSLWNDIKSDIAKGTGNGA